ncbi:MAG: transcriptional regulator, LysR family [Clostridia bacterium]|jgi:DNA-binding transcriptional LysR family regulator|nr:transcriptional regulator, LysR family [Clostridia bacterium]
MNLGYLKLFNTLATELSFSKAASLLYISQPAVSIQIKKLEEDLGFKLFDRVGKHLALTENGDILYQYTKKIFDLVDEADIVLMNKYSNLKGIVEIGASNTPGTYLLPRIMREFSETFPEVIANLHIGNTYEVEKMILENRVDFAIKGGDVIYNSKLYVEWLAEDEIIFITSPKSCLAGREYVDYHELEKCKFIVHEKNSRLYNLVQHILQDIDLLDNITMTMGHVDAIKQAVRLELGIAAVPISTVEDELKSGSLCQFRIKGKSWFYPYNLVYNKDRHRSPASRRLMELVRERMKEKRS